jgi:predicted MPP superfamily phosphohydrolase
MTITAPFQEPPLPSTDSMTPTTPTMAARKAWDHRRRIMERQKTHIGLDGARSPWSNRIFSVGVTVLGRGARVFGLHARGVRNALDVQLVELPLRFPDLPASFDGYRILHISDTHLDCLPELALVGRHLLAGIEVDLLVLTGDVHGHPQSPLTASVEPLADLLGVLQVRHRSIAVLGNHDPADMAGALENIGFEVLLNQSTALARQGQHIVVTGLDDVHRFFTSDASRALAAVSQGFRIALVHSAEVADHAGAAGYALYLCGHTHGGQVCLPGGRPIVTRLRRCRFAGVGEWRYGNMIGYTSRGLGVSDVPLRFNCRGEITLITLHRSHDI